MKSIEIPFALGDRVRTKDGREFVIKHVMHILVWEFSAPDLSWYSAEELTLVEPVLEWREVIKFGDHVSFVSGYWGAYPNGKLLFRYVRLGTFDNPKDVAEELQTIINERSEP